jgi:hypothetical protein
MRGLWTPGYKGAANFRSLQKENTSSKLCRWNLNNDGWPDKS